MAVPRNQVRLEATRTPSTRDDMRKSIKEHRLLDRWPASPAASYGQAQSFFARPPASLPRYFCRPRRGWRNRTPSPVPFSSMKSTPANSSACFRTARVACRGPVAPPSNCRIVATPIWAASASSCWVQSRRPLAALHCEAVSMALRTKATDSRQFDCFSIDIATNCFYIETTFNDTLEASDVG